MSESCRYVLALSCGLKNKRAVSTQPGSRNLREEEVPAKESVEGAAHELGGEIR